MIRFMRNFLLLFVAFSWPAFMLAQERAEKPVPIQLGTTYIGDAFANFSGGLKSGSSYMGFMDITASISPEALGLWKNGELFVNVQNTHGASLSGEYVGDAQVVSNIDNGDYTYLYQLWYKQNINNFSFIFGLHDLNAEFFASDFGGEYVASSLGIMPLASLNVPVAIFPKTTLALILKYEFNDQLAFQTAVYDGDPLDLDTVPYNSKLLIGDDHGIFSVSELHLSLNNSNGRNGSYKLGFYYHSAEFEDLTDANKTYSGNYGLYLMVDQMLFPKPTDRDKGLGAFLHFGISPDDRSMNDLFLAVGLNYYGVSESRSEDVIGLGVAYASLSNKLYDSAPNLFQKGETQIEFFYKLKLGEYITLQPEIQYMINPGFDKSIDNAFIGLFRTYVEF